MLSLISKFRKYVKNIPDITKPWELLDFLTHNNLETHMERRYVEGVSNEVYCGSNVTIQPYTLFTGKVFLGDNVRIGPFNFIRGPVIVADNSLIGPHSEVIRTVIGENSVLAHRNLLGDTVIDSDVQLAGGCTVCNMSVVKDKTKVYYQGVPHEYDGKFGAYIESNVALGAFTIIMPGTHIPRGTKVIGQCVIHGYNKVKRMVND